jgi:protein SCO1/2
LTRTTRIFVLILLVFAAVGSPARTYSKQNPKTALEIGINERLGDSVPGDLEFLDSYGNPVTLGALIDRPTVLTLVYYHCPSICKPLLGSVAEMMQKSDLVPGRDYNVVTISFDDTDTPESAAAIRDNFTNSLEKDMSDGGWRFLTADSAAIASVTEAVGFAFQRRESDFAHGTCLIVLSRERKIVRYLYGKSFLPFELEMAVSEATKGTVVPSIAKVVQYCFSYDPEGRRYVLNLNRIIGTGILIFAIGWLVFITSSNRRKRTAGT